MSNNYAFQVLTLNEVGFEKEFKTNSDADVSETVRSLTNYALPGDTVQLMKNGKVIWRDVVG